MAAEHRATINDVAREAEVSKSTVSAVINDSRPVSTETRDRVLEAVKALNYRPRTAARNRSHTSRSLGLVIKEQGNPFFSEVARGAWDRAQDAGYALYTASSEGDYATERHVVDDLVSRGVHGLMLYPVMNGDTDLSNLIDLQRMRMPFVLMERILGVKASVVDVNIVSAFKEAVRYLIEAGHRRIVHFAGPSYSMHSDERIDGMRRAFSESEIAFSEDLIVPAGAHAEDGYQAALAYFEDLGPDEHPTAATCFNDLVALGVMRAVTELGLSVPDDVSVVGCDGAPLFDFLPVQLTTIRSPSRDMGRRAADLLIEQIEADEQPSPQHVRFDPELIVRQSTRAMSA